MQVSSAIKALQERLTQQDSLSLKDVLLLRLNQQYPNDVGVLASLFLNFLSLKKGQVSSFPESTPGLNLIS